MPIEPFEAALLGRRTSLHQNGGISPLLVGVASGQILDQNYQNETNCRVFEYPHFLGGLNSVEICNKAEKRWRGSTD